jgi:hypothetical protein
MKTLHDLTLYDLACFERWCQHYYQVPRIFFQTLFSTNTGAPIGIIVHKRKDDGRWLQPTSYPYESIDNIVNHDAVKFYAEANTGEAKCAMCGTYTMLYKYQCDCNKAEAAP